MIRIDPTCPTALVVDDQAIFRVIESRVLRKVGHIVIEAANGKEAISLIEDYPIDVILTDLEMPEMDGEDLIETVRNHSYAEISSIPIAVVSSQCDPVTRAEVRALGGNAFLPKPIDSAKLIETVELLMVVG